MAARRQGAPGNLISTQNALASRIHSFKQWTKFGSMNLGNVATGYAFNFALTDLPGAQETEFQALFRMYRIDKVDVMFVPKASSATIGDWMSPVVFSGVTSVAVCYDDVVAPAAETDVLQFENVSIHRSVGDPWTVSFKPRAKFDTNNINSAPVESPWLDTANLAVAHYGIKIWNTILGGSVAAYAGIDMYACYHISFRTVC